MPSFKVTAGVLKEISSKFGMAQKTVAEIHDIYEKKILKVMRRHYLAHVIRTMEETLRQHTGNQMFRIICTPVDESKNLGSAGQYFKGDFFAITYNLQTDERQLRTQLAHELGHLFLIEFVNAKFGANYTEKTQIESLSTTMGIFTILDRNLFYQKNKALYTDDSPDDVLNGFHALANNMQMPKKAKTNKTASYFKITSKIAGEISRRFGIKENEINILHKLYQQEIVQTIKQQYLAHVIRGMEESIGHHTGNQMFRIICTPNVAISTKRGVVSQYQKGQFFAMFYHPKTGEKEVRYLLARQLGELFFLEFAENYKKPHVHPLSALIGIFIMLYKNEFYHNGSARLKLSSPYMVLDEFEFLTKRKKSK